MSLGAYVSNGVLACAINLCRCQREFRTDGHIELARDGLRIR
jgi:hypothetical protein